MFVEVFCLAFCNSCFLFDWAGASAGASSSVVVVPAGSSSSAVVVLFE